MTTTEYPWLEKLRGYYQSTVNRLDGRALECKVGRFFERWGAKVRVADPKDGHDFGVDVEVQYLGLTFLIQVKRMWATRTRAFIQDYGKRVAMKNDNRRWCKGVVLWLCDFDEECLTIWEPLHAFITKGWFSTTVKSGAKVTIQAWEKYHQTGVLPPPRPTPPRKKKKKGV